MSNEKKASVKDWDRMDGRRTIYFHEDECYALESLAKKAGDTEQDVVRRLVKEHARGEWVRKESLDAYKEVVDKFTSANRSVGGVPTYGTEEEAADQKRKAG